MAKNEMTPTPNTCPTCQAMAGELEILRKFRNAIIIAVTGKGPSLNGIHARYNAVQDALSELDTSVQVEWTSEFLPTHAGWWWKRRAHLVLRDGSFTWHEPSAVFIKEQNSKLLDTSWMFPDEVKFVNGVQWWPIPITTPEGGK